MCYYLVMVAHMNTVSLELKKLPTIGIFVRHSRTCPAFGTKGSEHSYRCKCWKWLRWREHGTLRRTPTHCRDLTGAERAKQELLKKWQAGTSGLAAAVKNEISVAEATDLYIKDKLQQGLSPNTISKHKRTVKRLEKFCEQKGVLLLNAVTPERVIEYRSTWTWARTPEVRRGEQTRLKSLFRWCNTNDLMPKNPALKLSRIKGDREPTMPFEPKEMESILKVAHPRARALIRLMRWSGLSIIDAATLAKKELRSSNGKYNVVRPRIKTRAPINNRIPADVAQELLALPNSNPKYFFWSGNGTAKTAAGYLTKMLKKVFDEAGIVDGHPHRLRDTAAVELLKAGVDIRAVSKFLGHQSVKTTERYYAPWNKAQQQILDNQIEAASERMEVA